MSEHAELQASPVVPGRECGTCTLCCKVLFIRELDKPMGRWCSHCKPGQGCMIHASRPQECRDFFCVWMVDPRLGAEWKPEKSKFVITNDKSGVNLMIRCDPGFPQAWRQEPYYSVVKQWARAAAAHQGTIVASVNTNVTLIAPDAEFALGSMQADDRIALNYSGGRLVGARVVKEGQV
jgi:hypothetical protein